MTTVTTFFQAASMVVGVVTLALVVVGWRRYRGFRGVFLPAGLFAGYGVVYYALLLSGRMTVDEVFLWGSAHRFLANVLVLGGTAALVWALGGKHDGR